MCRWCGSSVAEVEIYNSDGEQAIREMLFSFTILPAPLRDDVYLTVEDNSEGKIHTISASTHHLKLKFKPYEGKYFVFVRTKRQLRDLRGIYEIYFTNSEMCS